jgi:2-keto-3-deoxy-L-rhamnonate aldolase RhmA
MASYTLRQKLAAGQAVFGTMLTECLAPEVAVALAASGVDFFIIDTEHSPGDFHEIQALARAARQFGIAPLVRITDNEYFLVARALDCGAAGVVMPRIHTAADARRVVEAVKYPPLGRRGFSQKSHFSDFLPCGMPEYIERTNQETVVVVQVEYEDTLADLDNIVAVPGVDATMIGPQDLSVSLGVPGQMGHEKMKAAFRRVAESCARSPVAAGIHMRDLAPLLERKAQGYRFLVYSIDMALMMQALKQGLETLRAATAV